MAKLKLSKVLLAIDPAYEPHKYLTAAAQLTKNWKTRLNVISVIEPIPVFSDGISAIPAPPQAYNLKLIRTHLEKMLRPIKTRAEVKVVMGHPSYEIRKEARHKGIDLIIVGSHERKLLTRLLLGSVSESVVRESRQPVMILKGSYKPIRKICIPIDGSKSSLQAFQWAIVMARLLKAVLCPISIVEEEFLPPDTQYFFNIADQRKKMIEKRTKELKSWLVPFRGVRMQEPIVEAGDPKSDISQLAKKMGAGLIIMGSHGKNVLGFSAMGRVASRTIHHCHCSIMITRPKGWRYKVV